MAPDWKFDSRRFLVRSSLVRNKTFVLVKVHFPNSAFGTVIPSLQSLLGLLQVQEKVSLQAIRYDGQNVSNEFLALSSPLFHCSSSSPGIDSKILFSQRFSKGKKHAACIIYLRMEISNGPTKSHRRIRRLYRGNTWYASKSRCRDNT